MRRTDGRGAALMLASWSALVRLSGGEAWQRLAHCLSRAFPGSALPVKMSVSLWIRALLATFHSLLSLTYPLPFGGPGLSVSSLAGPLSPPTGLPSPHDQYRSDLATSHAVMANLWKALASPISCQRRGPRKHPHQCLSPVAVQGRVL